MQDQIIKGIKDGHLFCCGNDLGKIEKGVALFCEKCSSLYLPDSNKEKKITDYLKEDVNKEDA